MKAPAYLALLRPKQWAKNLLVFAALLFASDFENPQLALQACYAFIAMCMLSSATYIVNDLFDVRRDRAHPRKRHRPIASGAVSPSGAITISILLAALAFLLAWFTLRRAATGILACYVLLQVAYNAGWKRVAVADVFAVAIGFVLRATLGAAAISVPISGWLLFCTGALAMMMAFGKRRHEWIARGEERSESREALDDYSLPLLDSFVSISAASAAIFYTLYVLIGATAHAYPGLLLTSLFVYYGIGRYLFVIYTRNEGGEPELLLFNDPQILLTVVGFILVSVIAVATHFRTPFVGLPR